jgi:hypothetical protein
LCYNCANVKATKQGLQVKTVQTGLEIQVVLNIVVAGPVQWLIKEGQNTQKKNQPAPQVAKDPKQQTVAKGSKQQAVSPALTNVIYFDRQHAPLAAFVAQSLGQSSTKFKFQSSDKTKLVLLNG